MAKKLQIGTTEIIVPEKSDISSQIQAEGKGVPFGLTAGTGSAYTLTISGISAYTTGMIFAVKFHTENLVNATLNLNGLGAKSIYRNGISIPASLINTDDIYLLTYDGTNFVFTDKGYISGSSEILYTPNIINDDELTTNSLVVATIYGVGETININTQIDMNSKKITDVQKGTATTDVATIENLNDYVPKADIVNNVTSTDADKPLSANQGKVLKDLADTKANDNAVVKLSGNQTITGTKNFTGTLQYNGEEVATIQDLSTVFKYKGSVPTYSNLPTTNRQVGDVWNVEDTGKNFAWSGTAWDDLGGVVDLSNYYTKTQADSLLNAKVNANSAITGATKTKITYDSKGLVTAGADLSASDIPSLNASKITEGTFADARIASASTWNAKVAEAPTDSKAYVRVNGAWVAVTVTTVTW